MRAVNLMPDAGDRTGPRSAGMATYLVLGGLAALVLVSGLWALGDRQIGERRAALSRVSAEAAGAEARAAATAPYRRFAELAKARADTVRSLSSTRFDWAGALREISRVLPADAWLTSMTGTTSASASDPGVGGAAAPLPTFEIDGCTVAQARVARLMNLLRDAGGVRRVELRSSEKAEQGSSGATACGRGRAGDPQFSMAVYFAAPAAPAVAADAPAAAPGPVAAGATPAPAAGDSGTTAR